MVFLTGGLLLRVWAGDDDKRNRLDFETRWSDRSANTEPDDMKLSERINSQLLYTRVIIISCWHPISQTSALIFGRWQELNADSWVILVPAMPGSVFLCLKSLGMYRLKVMSSRDFGGSIDYNWNICLIFPHEIKEYTTPKSWNIRYSYFLFYWIPSTWLWQSKVYNEVWNQPTPKKAWVLDLSNLRYHNIQACNGISKGFRWM